MAYVLTAPDRSLPPFAVRTTAFLAGAIDMGAAVDWQAYVIEQCAPYDDIALFNPRRSQFSPDTLDEQIIWELTFLKFADTVFMWLPEHAKAPVSMFEAGLYWHSGKLMIGAAPGFYRRRNLEITGRFYGVRVWDDLDDMIHDLISGGVPF